MLFTFFLTFFLSPCFGTENFCFCYLRPLSVYMCYCFVFLHLYQLYFYVVFYHGHAISFFGFNKVCLILWLYSPTSTVCISLNHAHLHWFVVYTCLHNTGNKTENKGFKREKDKSKKMLWIPFSSYSYDYKQVKFCLSDIESIIDRTRNTPKK